VLAQPNTVKPHSKFAAKVYLLTAQEGGRKSAIYTNYKPQFFFRTSNVTGTISLTGEEPMVMPGDHTVLNIELFEKSPLTLGLKFVMREGNLTVGAGVISALH